MRRRHASIDLTKSSSRTSVEPMAAPRNARDRWGPSPVIGPLMSQPHIHPAVRQTALTRHRGPNFKHSRKPSQNPRQRLSSRSRNPSQDRSHETPFELLSPAWDGRNASRRATTSSRSPPAGAARLLVRLPAAELALRCAPMSGPRARSHHGGVEARLGAGRVRRAVSGSELSIFTKLLSLLRRWVSKEARPISLRQLMVFGRSLTESRLINSANYVRTELPTRFVPRRIQF